LYGFVENDSINTWDERGMDWWNPFKSKPREMIRKLWVRQVRREFFDAIFVHVELKGTGTHGFPDLQPGETERSYPVYKRNSGELEYGIGKGKKCECATDEQIQSCIDRSDLNGTAGNSTPGNNCQTRTLKMIRKCCMETDWEPQYIAESWWNWALLGSPAMASYIMVRKTWGKYNYIDSNSK